MSGSGLVGAIIRVHVDDSEDPSKSLNLRRDVVIELARRVLEEENRLNGELDIVFCGDKRITELNETWLSHDGPTDVIAFDLSEDSDSKSNVEGELYIDLEQAKRQAPQFGSTLDEEIRRLVIHGILHLAGYDDTGSREETEMMTERQEHYVKKYDMQMVGKAE